MVYKKPRLNCVISFHVSFANIKTLQFYVKDIVRHKTDYRWVVSLNILCASRCHSFPASVLQQLPVECEFKQNGWVIFHICYVINITRLILANHIILEPL